MHNCADRCHGWLNNYESYGHAAGASLADTALADALVLDPPASNGVAGDALCFQASVADSKGDAVPGLRVDFEVQGRAKENSDAQHILRQYGKIIEKLGGHIINKPIMKEFTTSSSKVRISKPLNL